MKTYSLSLSVFAEITSEGDEEGAQTAQGLSHQSAEVCPAITQEVRG